MKIPSSSISRISLYYRAVLSAKPSVISSEELALMTAASAAQVRKDLAYFGQFGTPGRGYSVDTLKKELKKILGTDREWDVAIVGAGNLGSALMAYKGFKHQGFNIKYAFDNDPKKVDRLKQGIRIQPIEELARTIKARHVNIAIVAVPQDAAQDVIDKLVSSGIKAILNFAPKRHKVPEDIEVLNIDLSMELERLTYFLQRGRR
ncbi:MAG: redox-sensing transcriptional repressor Rex [Candidatus Omnitrophica bacterium]|nr:redox-sensing transcriptional repressor Rex [Candidatus Omnitrophota bacterium]MBU1932549.1 redox-sensing transcriptional repressor Rex [Candidatus Omnitrophota bacterium]